MSSWLVVSFLTEVRGLLDRYLQGFPIVFDCHSRFEQGLCEHMVQLVHMFSSPVIGLGASAHYCRSMNVRPLYRTAEESHTSSSVFPF